MTASSIPIDVQEAVVADARRHARRRRRCNVAIVLVVFLLVGAAARHFAGRGSTTTPQGLPAVSPAVMHNGLIAILSSRAGPNAGWYGVSRVGLDGKLHAFIRCPGHAKW